METELKALFAVFPAVFLRCTGVLVLLPVGSGLSGVVSRLFISAGLALVLGGGVPMVAQASTAAYLGEFLIGVLLAVPAALVLSGAAMFGELFDITRGATLGQFYDPSFESSVPTMGLLLRQLSWLLLLLLGFMETLLGGLVASFNIVPAASFPAMDLVRVGYELMAFTGAILVQLISLFLPFGVLFLLISLAVGYLGKVLPQVALHGESFALKTALGFWMLYQFSIGVDGGRLFEAAQVGLAFLTR